MSNAGERSVFDGHQTQIGSISIRNRLIRFIIYVFRFNIRVLHFNIHYETNQDGSKNTSNQFAYDTHRMRPAFVMWI